MFLLRRIKAHLVAAERNIAYLARSSMTKVWRARRRESKFPDGIKTGSSLGRDVTVEITRGTCINRGSLTLEFVAVTVSKAGMETWDRVVF